MIIGIDGNEANISQRVGIGQYAYQVLMHLYERGKGEGERGKVRFIIYLKDLPLADMPVETAWWTYRVFGPKRLWTQVAFPWHLLTTGPRPDVIFSPSHYAPRFSRSPRVISVMDVSFLHFPELFTAKDLHQLRSWTAYSVQKAKKIFTISEYSKQDIMKSYGVSHDRVVVTYPGYDETKFTHTSLPKRKILGDYILFVGTVQPRKNIVRLIEAFEIVKRASGRVPSGTPASLQLIIAGKKGWLWEDIVKRMETSPFAKDIVHLDFVPEEDLPSLYHHARCFVLPSLHEGFGIPVVEAMACGCPVIVSNTTSLPEVVGDAALVVDPYNIDEMASAIMEAGYNIRTRETLMTRGLKQVKQFSWETCAQQTLDVLKTGAGL